MRWKEDFFFFFLNTVFCTEALHKEKEKKKNLIIVLNVQNAMSTKSPVLISTSN